MKHDQSLLPPLKPVFARTGSKSKSKAQNSSSVVSIRVSQKERAELERRAAGQNLSTYVRSVLFSDTSAKPSKTSDYKKTVAQVLGRLGKSPHIGTLQGVLRACDEGALVLHEDAEGALRTACAQVEETRRELLAALGLRPK